MINPTHRYALLLFLTVCATRADQITLKNGDRVTGAIVKKAGNALTVKSEFMGEVTIPWDQIAGIRSTAPLNVELPDTTVQAVLESDNGQIRLSGGSATPRSVAPATIVAIRNTAEESEYERTLHPNLLQLWTGTANIGLAGTLGNAQTSTFTTSVNASRSTTHDKTSLYFNTVKASASVSGVRSETAQAVRGGWKYGRKVGPRLDVDLFNDNEYDRFQNLDLRFVLGGGLGYRTWQGSRGSLGLQGGVNYDHEKFSPSASAAGFSRSSSDAYWGDEFSYRLSAATNVVQSFRMFNNLSDLGAWRANFDTTANTKLRKWLVWNLSFSNRYLSNPAPGRKKDDVLYTTGIGLTFGH